MSGNLVIHVIDDDVALLHSAQLLLTTEGFTAKIHASAEQFLAAFDEDGGDCVVTDVCMAGLDGITLLSTLRERGVALPVIVVTGHADIPLAVRAIKQGAFNLLEKPFRAQELIASIRQACGASIVAPAAVAAKDGIEWKFSTLTPRERDVLEGLLRGHPNKIIAHDLGISQRTVEIHRAHLMRKTQAGSLAELVRMTLSIAKG